jgi:hypothetical protein
MEIRTITSIEHTTSDGKLNLTVDLGIPNEDVSVVVQVRPVPRHAETDASGWPVGYFDTVPGSMPELRRMAQGEFEERKSFE